MEATVTSPAQPQCQFFVLRKKRLCRMTVRPGRQFCGEHEPQPLADDHQIDTRVPCPNDPKHTCYVSKLEKHLTKCNARQVADPPYIVRNINTCEEGDSTQWVSLETGEEGDSITRVPLKNVPPETLQRVIQKVNSLYQKHVESSISTFSPPLEHHPAVGECIAQQDRAESSRRHLRQVSRLLQLAEHEGLVGDDTCIVDLGAGKGMLSYYMSRAWCGEGGGSRVVCVDRASLRHKRDNRVAGAVRLRADLRHLALERVPAVQRAAAVLGVGKHLCGVATDYAVRCMTGGGVVHKSRGLLLATCCHHRCEWLPYVGRHKLQELGVTSEELAVVLGIVSWATCGDGRARGSRRDCGTPPATENDRDITQLNFREMTNEEIDTNEGKPGRGSEADTSDSKVPSLPLSRRDRELVGRRAKALVEYGRVLYLRARGLSARLVHYVPATDSLENLCIVAKKLTLSQ